MIVKKFIDSDEKDNIVVSLEFSNYDINYEDILYYFSRIKIRQHQDFNYMLSNKHEFSIRYHQ